MNWIDKLERKIGNYAIPNLNRLLVFAILIGYLITYTAGGMMNYLAFSAGDILHGQIWRLITWVIIPPGALSFFTLLFLFCLIPMGRTLESLLGTFRMNVYIFGGIIISDLGALVFYLITKLVTGYGMSPALSTYYILLSTFMALALCMPDATVNLYFVLPIKMKWMLLVYFLDLGYQVYANFKYAFAYVGSFSSSSKLPMSKGGLAFMIGFANSAQILFAILNLFLFFYFIRSHVSFKQKKRQRAYKQQFAQPRPGSGITRHKCAICGRTEASNPELTFRYCSKCVGSKEYCNDHLFTHQHVE